MEHTHAKQDNAMQGGQDDSEALIDDIYSKSGGYATAKDPINGLKRSAIDADYGLKVAYALLMTKHDNADKLDTSNKQFNKIIDCVNTQLSATKDKDVLLSAVIIYLVNERLSGVGLIEVEDRHTINKQVMKELLTKSELEYLSNYMNSTDAKINTIYHKLKSRKADMLLEQKATEIIKERLKLIAEKTTSKIAH